MGCGAHPAAAAAARRHRAEEHQQTRERTPKHQQPPWRPADGDPQHHSDEHSPKCCWRRAAPNGAAAARSQCVHVPEEETGPSHTMNHIRYIVCAHDCTAACTSPQEATVCPSHTNAEPSVSPEGQYQWNIQLKTKGCKFVDRQLRMVGHMLQQDRYTDSPEHY